MVQCLRLQVPKARDLVQSLVRELDLSNCNEALAHSNEDPARGNKSNAAK